MLTLWRAAAEASPSPPYQHPVTPCSTASTIGHAFHRLDRAATADAVWISCQGVRTQKRARPPRPRLSPHEPRIEHYRSRVHL